MHVLVLASQKGGSGKTTLSGHLAVEATNAGVGPVALIDTDPQGSLSHWWNARQAQDPFFVKVGLLDLSDVLGRLAEAGIKLAVIDTPPAITESISHVIGHSDLVILPTRPSPHDLRAVGATVDIAERHDKTVLFVINAATPRARITGEAAVALSQHGTVAPVTIHHRVDFAASMVDGRTVGEVVPKSASAREIRELWIYVQGRLSKLKRDAAMTPEFVPQNFAVSGLSGADDKDTVEADTSDSDAALFTAMPPSVEPPASAMAAKPVQTPPPYPGEQTYTGPERRAGGDRRRVAGDPPPGMANRRVQPFGRRSTDPSF
jgi:chromosome partitioning protein